MGLQARYEMFMARMMYVIASGKHIDDSVTDDFRSQIDAVYKNPFEKKNRKRQPQTAEEIKQYVLCFLEGKEWT